MRQFSIRVGKVKVKPRKGLGPIGRRRLARELAVIAELTADLSAARAMPKVDGMRGAD